MRDLKPMLLDYADQWQRLAEPLWHQRYAAVYAKNIADAHALSESHDRQHPSIP